MRRLSPTRNERKVPLDVGDEPDFYRMKALPPIIHKKRTHSPLGSERPSPCKRRRLLPTTDDIMDQVPPPSTILVNTATALPTSALRLTNVVSPITGDPGIVGSDNNGIQGSVGSTRFPSSSLDGSYLSSPLTIPLGMEGRAAALLAPSSSGSLLGSGLSREATAALIAARGLTSQDIRPQSSITRTDDLDLLRQCHQALPSRDLCLAVHPSVLASRFLASSLESPSPYSAPVISSASVLSCDSLDPITRTGRSLGPFAFR
mmetsp:Transcript_29433/g.68105  ORF Transcript_29433/g.68105 Transcript_29433/m.68105 type:complete len:261 (+) Transcript_29433:667-1449(+)|eukprot:CAMPEP_0116841628 /NCGR_PEP_ID=MMETSP0418-20121206/11046_1 /TAXON_ID=1158023 /ORGANISM="Astrosyne radiata, Strain 13vi08-1A" /LENGTH=260 /DNA_ID=CAMNT_0004472107 /DNA_START=570 /DNA_END=1352 /DNA_ORIENTATION=+